MKHVAVVGGTGFIGGAVVGRLKQSGISHHLVTRRCHDLGPGSRYGDLQRPESLPAALEGADVVIQSTTFRGYPFEKRRQGWTFMEFDGYGTERLVEAAKRSGVQRYVFVSGVGASDDGREYFRAIRHGEKAIISSGLEYAILRPAFVYGPNDAGLNKVVGWAKHTPVVPAPGLDSMHQPVYVDDVAKALVELCRIGGPQGVFEIGGPDKLTMRRMLQAALQKAQLKTRLVQVPYPLAAGAGLVLQKLPGEPLCKSAVDFICEPFLADTGPLLRQLPNLTLTPFEEGLERWWTARQA